MRIQWFWPFPHRRELALANATRRPGDVMVVESRRPEPGTTLPATRSYQTVRDLANVPPLSAPTPARLARRLTVYPGRARARAALAREFSPDVLHVHAINYPVDWYAFRSLRRRTALVASVHDVRPHEAKVPSAVETWLLRQCYENGGHLVVAHPVLRERLAAEFGVDPARVTVVPLPVPEVARAARNGDAAPRRVLFFGSLRPNKGLPDLFRAWETVGRQTDAVLHVAGGDYPDGEALTRAAAASLPRVEAEVGRVSDRRKDELFRASDVVVLPYRSFASQSGVLTDAYAYGRALVVSDVGALGDSVRADGTGWVVPPGDPDALTRALTRALRDDEARAAAASAAAAAADDRTMAKVGARFRALYDSVAAS